jgi:transposase
MEERRLEGIRLLQTGEMTQAEISRHLGVSGAAVSRWKKKLVVDGAATLEMRKATGRPPKLDQQAKAALVEKLTAGALAAGFPTEQWTQARVKQVIECEFGVRYHQNYIGRLLDDLGWSVQKPDARAIERDEELIQAWLRKDWPRIKKSAAARRRDRV